MVQTLKREELLVHIVFPLQLNFLLSCVKSMENGRTWFLKGKRIEKVSVHNVKDYIGAQQEKNKRRQKQNSGKGKKNERRKEKLAAAHSGYT